MATAITITIDGEAPAVPEYAPADDEGGAEAPASGLIDRGPLFECSHSSWRESVQEIAAMVGRRVQIYATLRGEDDTPLGYHDGILAPIRFGDDGELHVSFEEQKADISPPVENAVDRHVENGQVVLRTASGYEMEFQVIGGE